MSEKPKFTPGPWRVWRHVNEKYPPMSQTAVFGTGDKKFVMIAQMHDDGAAVPEQTVHDVLMQNDNLTTIDLANSTAATICGNNCCWKNCSSCPVCEIIRLLGVMKEQTETLKNEVDGEA